MKRQEAFNDAVRGLWDQAALSTSSMRCRYRGPNGTKCAVGMLIPDENYHACLENKGAWVGEVKAAVDSKYGPLDTTNNFLADMQSSLHDSLNSWSDERFLAGVAHIAQKYELEIPNLPARGTNDVEEVSKT